MPRDAHTCTEAAITAPHCQARLLATHSPTSLARSCSHVRVFTLTLQPPSLCATVLHVQVGTFTLFQETYHRPTFAAMHISGPKSDYGHRLLTQVRHARARACSRPVACCAARAGSGSLRACSGCVARLSALHCADCCCLLLPTPPSRPPQDRAFRGGIDDVGIGTLFGLYDYR